MSSPLQPSELTGVEPDLTDALQDRTEAGQRIGDLHVLADPLRVGGRSWVKCSCGLVLEVFGSVRRDCPVWEAEVDYMAAVANARMERDRVVARWRGIAIYEQAELHRLTGTTATGELGSGGRTNGSHG